MFYCGNFLTEKKTTKSFNEDNQSPDQVFNK